MATNLQWGFGFSAAGLFQYFAEQNAGVDIVYATTVMAQLTPGWYALAMTRSAGQIIRFYAGGVLLDTSPVMGAPNGGTSSGLGIGAYSNGSFPVATSCIGQVAIWDVELTPSQVLRGARMLFGAHR